MLLFRKYDDDVYENISRYICQFTKVVYVTIGKHTAFCLALYLTSEHIRGESQHVGHVGEQKTKSRLIRT